MSEQGRRAALRPVALRRSAGPARQDAASRHRAWRRGARGVWQAGAVPNDAAVLVVEDDPHIAELVSMCLTGAGYRVRVTASGANALELSRQERPRLVVLDIGLPGDLDGLEVCRRLRARDELPVLFLTARDAEVDRVVGLELGADDYVTKPFSPRELLARVRAILRRSEPAPRESPTTFSLGELEVDTGRHEARRRGTPIPLTTREFDLLVYLAENQGLVLSRRQLLDGVWGGSWVGDERTVDVHVGQLRKKLGPGLPLATVWGVGYRLG